MMLTDWVVHILFGGSSWLPSALGILITYLYHMAFYLTLHDYETEPPTRFAGVLFIIGVSHSFLMILSYVSEKKDKINFCVIKY